MENIETQFESIESERLTLVPLSFKYKEEMFREFTSSVTKHMFPSTPESIADTESFIEKTIEKTKAGEEVVFNVLSKDTKEFIGCVGVHRIHTKHPELGIWIKESAQGNGYGLESVLAVKEWADKNISYEYLVYPVAKDNSASIKIALALGGAYAGTRKDLNQAGEEMLVSDYHIFPDGNVSDT